jgi:hypothetical protein
VSSSGYAGDIAKEVSVLLAGIAAASLAGNVGTSQNITQAITGVQASGQLGVIYPPWGVIDDSQTPSWQEITTAQTAAWQAISEAQTANWQEITTI